MDQQNYYYGKHNLASLNYQSPYSASTNDYTAAAYNESTPQSLYHGALISQQNSSEANNSSSSNNSSSTHCSDNSSTASSTTYRTPTYNHPNASEYSSNAAYSRYYQSYIADQALAPSTTASNTADCNHLSYGTAAYTGKSYEAATHPTQVPVIAAATSNGSQANNNYTSNTIHYGASYQNVDYHTQKSLNTNYGSSAALLAGQNRTTMDASIPFAAHENNQSIPSTAKSRAANATGNKMSAKTSVIKPNMYNNSASTPINYTTKYGAYQAYGNQKPTPSVDKQASTNNRDMYNAPNHKSGEVYCPEPISARYTNSNYALNVSAAATAHSNPTYLSSNNFHIGYGHHLTQPQSAAHHGRNTILAASGYQAALEDSMHSGYLNRQNNLLVRPTPNPYKQCQLAYPNTYCYGRNMTGNNSTGNSSSTSSISKSQTQKLITDATNLPIESSVDRRYLKQYGSMYGLNYLNPSSNYDAYSQYSSFAASNENPASYFPPTTHSQKILYNYNNGLNAYSTNMNGSHLSLATSQSSLSSMATSSATIPTTTVTTTASIVQQPVPINPNTSQLISNNYDSSSLHSILTPSLYNSQYQQSTYSPQILYQTLQSANYLSSMKAGVAAVGTTEKIYPDKAKDRYNVSVDLEEQINSSRIPKQAKSSQPSTAHATIVPSTGTAMYSGYGNVIGNRNYDIQMKVPGEVNATRIRNPAIANNYDGYAHTNYHYQKDNRKVHDDQQHIHWQKSQVPNANSTTTTVASASTATPTVYMHPKKQNLREFLSSWNEFEDEDGSDASRNKTVKSNQYTSAGNDTTPSVAKSHNYEKRDKLSESTVVVQPIPQFPQPSQHLMQASMIPPPTYHHHHHHHHHQATVPVTSVPLIPPPKINIGITVDSNGSQNLPDIVIDIEKQKPADGECFERANVIQTIPKLNSEKLYILDSIDVPLTDLNKYRHVSVFNEGDLPSNIVLPPPPPLRHEDSVPVSDKCGADLDGSQGRFFDVDFGRCNYNVADDDKTIVECKNTITMRKIIKKYLKQDYLRRKKPPPMETRPTMNEDSNLSTPLKSLSPVHEFDITSTPDGLFGGSYPVDLSTHNKESVDEFINNWSICSGDTGSEFDLIGSPLAEIMQLTASPELNPMLDNNATNQVIDRLLSTSKTIDESIHVSDTDSNKTVNNEKIKDLDQEKCTKEEPSKKIEDEKLEDRGAESVQRPNEEKYKKTDDSGITSAKEIEIEEIIEEKGVHQSKDNGDTAERFGEKAVEIDKSTTKIIGGESEIQPKIQTNMFPILQKALDDPRTTASDIENPLESLTNEEQTNSIVTIVIDSQDEDDEPLQSVYIPRSVESAQKHQLAASRIETEMPRAIEHITADYSQIVISDDDNNEEIPSAAENSAIEDNASVDLNTRSNNECDMPNELLSTVCVDSLQTICVQEINTKEYRDYFVATVLKPRPNEIDHSEQIEQLDEAASASSDDIMNMAKQVPSLRSLARQMVMFNQSCITLNLRSAQIAYNYECDGKALDPPTDSNIYRVKTLKQLAHEVANTIYSFNVKPLQDICKIAIEKYNNLYQIHRTDVDETDRSMCMEEMEVDRSQELGKYL